MWYGPYGLQAWTPPHTTARFRPRKPDREWGRFFSVRSNKKSCPTHRMTSAYVIYQCSLLKNLFFLHKIRLGNSPFCSFTLRSSLYCSKLLKLKSEHERFAQVTINKKTTMSQSLRSLITKERPEQIAQKRAIRLEKVWENYICCMLLTVFERFPPFLYQRANCSRRSSLICSFLKSNRE